MNTFSYDNTCITLIDTFKDYTVKYTGYSIPFFADDYERVLVISNDTHEIHCTYGSLQDTVLVRYSRVNEYTADTTVSSSTDLDKFIAEII